MKEVAIFFVCFFALCGCQTGLPPSDHIMVGMNANEALHVLRRVDAVETTLEAEYETDELLKPHFVLQDVSILCVAIKKENNTVAFMSLCEKPDTSRGKLMPFIRINSITLSKDPTAQRVATRSAISNCCQAEGVKGEAKGETDRISILGIAFTNVQKP